MHHNKNTGAVDKLDQQLSYYPVGRPEKKWWRCNVWLIINITLYNAFVIWNKSAHNFPILKTYDPMMLRCDIADGLINDFCSVNFLQEGSYMPPTGHSRGNDNRPHDYKS